MTEITARIYKEPDILLPVKKRPYCSYRPARCIYRLHVCKAKTHICLLSNIQIKYQNFIHASERTFPHMFFLKFAPETTNMTDVMETCSSEELLVPNVQYWKSWKLAIALTKLGYGHAVQQCKIQQYKNSISQWTVCSFCLHWLHVSGHKLLLCHTQNHHLLYSKSRKNNQFHLELDISLLILVMWVYRSTSQSTAFTLISHISLQLLGELP